MFGQCCCFRILLVGFSRHFHLPIPAHAQDVALQAPDSGGFLQLVAARDGPTIHAVLNMPWYTTTQLLAQRLTFLFSEATVECCRYEAFVADFCPVQSMTLHHETPFEANVNRELLLSPTCKTLCGNKARYFILKETCDVKTTCYLHAPDFATSVAQDHEHLAQSLEIDASRLSGLFCSKAE